MAPVTPLASIPVGRRSDVHAVLRAVRAVAAEAGIADPETLGRLALAASELATNLAQHVHGGRIAVTAVERNGRRGVEVRGDDDGPGIPDLERALRDGVSTGSGLGGGLGAMRRAVDEFAIDSSPAGTHVVLTTWVRPI